MPRLRALAEELVSPTLFVRIVEALPDALIVVNDQGDIVLVNAQAELLFGYHRSELIGEKVELLVPEAKRAVHPQHREGFVADPRVRPMGADLHLTARHKSGRELAVKINLSPLMAPEGLFVSAVIRATPTVAS